jgi:hypothetical protein
VLERMPGFSVDLDRLNNVAKTDIPDIITGVNDAQSAINTALNDQGIAFQGVTEGLESDSYWLSEDLLTGLHDLSVNLGEAKAAMHEIANRYRVADGQPPYPAV